MTNTSARGTLDRIIVSAARIFKVLEPVLDAKEKVEFAADAGAKAMRAAAIGQLSANDPTIEEARAKAHALSRWLGKLAKRDENFWIERSPYNLLQPATGAQATAWLQQKSTEFVDLKRVVDGQIPLVHALKVAYRNPGIMGVRQVLLGPTSLHALDDWALEEIETSLRACSTHLSQIETRLRNTRAALEGRSR